MKPHGPDWLHFAKGSYIHELLHFYYFLIQQGYEIGDEIVLTAIKDRVKSDLHEAIERAKEEGTDVDLKFFDDCSRVIVNYVTNFSPRNDHTLSKISIEKHLELFHAGRNFHGFVDLIYWDTELKVWVIRDHKTGTQNRFDLKATYRSSQLLFYGTLLYKLNGIVADLEISYINSAPPRNPKKTVLWDRQRVRQTAEKYDNYWKYLLEVNERQNTVPCLRNFNACGNCAYFPICNTELKNQDSGVIIRTRYAQPKVQPENSNGGSKNSETLRVTF